jgi:hypothetical protein
MIISIDYKECIRCGGYLPQTDMIFYPKGGCPWCYFPRKFGVLRGRELDRVGKQYGMERKGGRWWWPFKEFDRAYRKRILNCIKR